MVLYNVTISLDESIEKEWLVWMNEKHILDVMNTGMFLDKKIFRLLSHKEEGAVTYTIQYFTDSMEKIQQYQEKYAEALQEEHTEKFKDKFVAFRTMLESVDYN